MRSGMITLGIILLVIGAIFYFMPTQSAAAGANGAVQTATLSLPTPISVALMVIGFGLLILGLVVPYDAWGTYVEDRRYGGRTGRRVVHERHVRERL
jgi:hypothetical protein